LSLNSAERGSESRENFVENEHDPMSGGLGAKQLQKPVGRRDAAGVVVDRFAENCGQFVAVLVHRLPKGVEVVPWEHD